MIMCQTKEYRKPSIFPGQTKTVPESLNCVGVSYGHKKSVSQGWAAIDKAVDPVLVDIRIASVFISHPLIS